MQKKYRLSHNSSFQYVFKNGKRLHSDILIMYALAAASTKLGVSVNKRVGNSVVRNKTKRHIKEAFRQIIPQIQKPHNFVVVAKDSITAAGFADITQTLSRLIQKAGAMGGEG